MSRGGERLQLLLMLLEPAVRSVARERAQGDDYTQQRDSPTAHPQSIDQKTPRGTRVASLGGADGTATNPAPFPDQFKIGAVRCNACDEATRLGLGSDSFPGLWLTLVAAQSWLLAAEQPTRSAMPALPSIWRVIVLSWLTGARTDYWRRVHDGRSASPCNRFTAFCLDRTIFRPLSGLSLNVSGQT